MAIDLRKELQLLKILHDVDLVLLQADDQLKAIPERRAVAEADYLAVKQVLDAKQAERDAAEKSKRSEELELAAEVERIRERETKLYAIKTNKEYQAALKEIADGKKASREREERILQQMEVVESTTKEITQLSATLADKESGCREAVKALEAEAATLEQEVATRKAERQRVVTDVGRDVLRLYDHVRQRYRDAVARVERGICQGCNMRIPPQQFIELQRWTSLGQCPSCYRILCPSEEAPTPSEKNTV